MSFFFFFEKKLIVVILNVISFLPNEECLWISLMGTLLLDETIMGWETRDDNL